MVATPVLRLPPKEFLVAPPTLVNPTVGLFVLSVGLLVTSTLGYWCWGWWAPVCFTCNVLALHLAGTVIHDASHQAAHRNPWVNAALGHVSALILGFTFPVFTRVHIQHHAHVNDPENDPDHFVSTGGPLWLIAARFFYHEIYFFQRRLWQKNDLWEWGISRLLVAGIIGLACYYGFLGYIMNFWFSPALVVGLALGLFFDYLPHRPFRDRGRWTNARVYPSRIWNWLILGQNYHLIHHLWPSIPWYHYQRVYYLMQPTLTAHGSPQTLGLLEPKSFWGFIYDLFIGIRWHRESAPPPPDKSAETPGQPAIPPQSAPGVPDTER